MAVRQGTAFSSPRSPSALTAPGRPAAYRRSLSSRYSISRSAASDSQMRTSAVSSDSPPFAPQSLKSSPSASGASAEISCLSPRTSTSAAFAFGESSPPSIFLRRATLSLSSSKFEDWSRDSTSPSRAGVPSARKTSSNFSRTLYQESETTNPSVSFAINGPTAAAPKAVSALKIAGLAGSLQTCNAWMRGWIARVSPRFPSASAAAMMLASDFAW